MKRIKSQNGKIVFDSESQKFRQLSSSFSAKPRFLFLILQMWWRHVLFFLGRITLWRTGRCLSPMTSSTWKIRQHPYYLTAHQVANSKWLNRIHLWCTTQSFSVNLVSDPIDKLRIYSDTSYNFHRIISSECFPSIVLKRCSRMNYFILCNWTCFFPVCRMLRQFLMSHKFGKHGNCTKLFSTFNFFGYY